MRISDWSSDVCSSDLDWSAARDQVTRDYGMKRMVTAAGGGQIVEPTGMNYVGTGPSWSRTVVAELLPRIFAKSRQIAFIERSEESRVGKECVRTCRSRWSTYH